MPRLPTDYLRNIIYKICCLDPNINDIYIGQTTEFINRKYAHKFNCLNETSKNYNLYVYKFIRENGGWDNWQMIQIEEFPCKNKREAAARETYYMKELKSTLNSRQSFTTEEERKEQIKENHKEWRKTDKYKEYEKTDKRKQYNKEYQKTEKVKNYRKEYKQTNKYKEYKKIYNQTKALYLNELKCFNID